MIYFYPSMAKQKKSMRSPSPGHGCRAGGPAATFALARPDAGPRRA